MICETATIGAIGWAFLQETSQKMPVLSPLLTIVAWSVILFFVHLLIQDTTMTRERGLAWNMGARDGTPQALSDFAARADRAFTNYRETYVVFLAVTVLCLFVAPLSRLAIGGAWVWFIARIVYLPLYLGGIQRVRSIVWLVSIAGLIAMLVAGFV